MINDAKKSEERSTHNQVNDSKIFVNCDEIELLLLRECFRVMKRAKSEPYCNVPEYVYFALFRLETYYKSEAL